MEASVAVQDVKTVSKQFTQGAIDPLSNVKSASGSPIPTADYWLATAVCFLGGILGFFIYYQMAMSFVVLRNIWKVQVFAFLLGGCEYGVAALISIIMVPFNGMKTRYIYFSCFIYVIVAFLFPLVVWKLPGMENFEMARALLVVISLFTGAADGLMTFSSLTLAAKFPVSRIVWYSGGAGFSGGIPWVFFLIICAQLSETSTLSDQTTAIGVFFLVGGLVSVAQIGCLTALRMRPWFKEFMASCAAHHQSQFVPGQNRWKQIFSSESGEQTKLQDPERKETSTSGYGIDSDFDSFGPPRGFVAVAKDCWLPAFSSFFLIISTMMLYPTIAPYGFHLGDLWTTVLNGVGHIFHTVMRFLPALMPITQIDCKWLVVAIVLRSAFYFPLFVAVNRNPGIAVISSPWFLFGIMMLFASTHGWAATLTDMYTPGSVKHPQERAMASKLLVIFQLLACCVGQFAGGLLTL